MKKKTVYICTECGYGTQRWLGKCPDCGTYGSLTEQVEDEPVSEGLPIVKTEAFPLDEMEQPRYVRTETGCKELDRVLGGGIVKGSVILICGEPGIGKSTLLMQICPALARAGGVLYASGEESAGQLKMRADRLGIKGEGIYILADTVADCIISHAENLKPSFLIVDSIQTTVKNGVPSAPGSVNQIKEAASSLIRYAKESSVSVILVGHINKEGAIAGPKTLEHMVDAVLYFEGERRMSFRLVRSVKNRYGATDEVGVFEMTEAGLSEVDKPSEALMKGRPVGISGNCPVCTLEGTRPIISEIQALVTPSYYPSPKRMSSGFDPGRLMLLTALLEKRLGLKFSSSDCCLNVIGGISLSEPASDLAAALALISSIRDIPLPDDVIAVGELGLAGEVRAVPHIEKRIREAERLGFRRIIVPERGYDKAFSSDSITTIPVKGIFDAVRILQK